MELLRRTALPIILLATVTTTSAGQDADPSADENQCLACHGNQDVWEGETLHLLVTAADLQADVHWQRGLSCQDCHGGNAKTFNLREAHAIEDGFRAIQTPADVPAFCGHCHSNLEYMRRFQPSIQTDPVAEFITSVHGQWLRPEPDGTAAPAATATQTAAPEPDTSVSETTDATQPDTSDTAAADAEAIDAPATDAAPPAMQRASCLACHPKHNMRTAQDPQSSLHPRRILETCGSCHRDQLTSMRKGVHHAVGERNEQGAGTPLDCLKCHGRHVHQMLPVTDSRSPVFLDHQVALCGSCHDEHGKTYNASVHGHGLFESGLLVTAVCADCHGAHDIYYAADRRSTLHRANVAVTCGECHRYIEDSLQQSVHRQDGGSAESQASSGKTQFKPGCVDCHQGHDEPRHLATGYRLQLPNRCGNCHADLLLGYNVSMHGQLTRLGYEPAAKCSDCHGAHDTLGVNNSKSRLAGANRLKTCGQCHTNAVQNFVQFDPHANHKDEQRYASLHRVYARIDSILYLLFGLFLLHAILWYGRSLLSTLRYGRHKTLVTQKTAIVRFSPAERVGYAAVILSVMGLIFTGLPLKYSGQLWAQRFVKALGGFESTSVCHHFFAVILLTTCAVHLVMSVKRIVRLRQQGVAWKRLFFGPNSLAIRLRDMQDLGGMIRWFFGAGPKPRFERWTYWEKFDYWVTCLVVIVVGLSGLMLWLPNVFCRVLPGWSLNVAAVLHSETALLGAGLLLIIHLFNTHLRPEKFPMDLSLVTGLVSEQHLQRARPEYVERLRAEGRLELIDAPPRRQLWMIVLIVYLLLFLGLLLLVWMLLASLGK